MGAAPVNTAFTVCTARTTAHALRIFSGSAGLMLQVSNGRW